MTVHEVAIESTVDRVISFNRTTPIVYFPYALGTVDRYRQRVKTFGSSTELIGRAILNPTPEKVSVIGNDEQYEIAFLFSRLQLVEKFSTAAEGEWLDVSGEMTWFNRRFKIEKVAPSGQVGASFSLVIVLANTLDGQRDP